MKILAGAKIVDGKLQVHIDIQDPELELDEKKRGGGGGGKPGRGGPGRWVTIMGRHVFIGSDGVPRAGPNGPKVDVDRSDDGPGGGGQKPDSKPKPEAEKPKPKPEAEKPKPEAEKPKPKPEAESDKPVSKFAKFGSGNKAEAELAESASQWSEGTDYFDNKAVKAYAGTSDSFRVNACARVNCTDKQLRQKADDLAKVIDKAKFPKDAQVSRSINAASAEERGKLLAEFKANVGKEFTDNAFVSTTANKKYADEWGKNAKAPPIKVTVLVPKGSKAIYLPKDIVGRQEWEVLIQRGSKFKVREASDSGEVVLELLP